MSALTTGPLSSIDLGGAEIATFSSEHAVALVTGGDNSLRLVNLSSISNPQLLSAFALPAAAQSVAVSGDLVAVALVNPTDKAEEGSILFLRLSGTGEQTTLTALGEVKVGALPDSVAFNAAGTRLVVANEGEAIDSTTTDAVGSISLIDVSSFTAATTDANGFAVTTLGFEAYNNQKVKLGLLGIRLNEGTPGATAAQDFEPEAIAIVGNKAYVTLQENNAIAEVDLASGKLSDIWSLGIKDWSRGTPEASNYAFDLAYTGTRPDFNGNGTVEAGEVIAGGLSGLWYEGKEGTSEFYLTISDRGPQAANIGDRPNDNPNDPNRGEKIFDDPDFAPTVYRLANNDGVVTVVDTISLKVPDGNGGFRLATGIGELPGTDDKAFALKTAGNGIAGDPNQYNVYEQVGWDAFGLDTESINAFTLPGLNGGNPVFAVSDEYRPQVALFDASTGNLIQRFVASNTVFNPSDYAAGRGDVAGYTTFSLPAVYGDRQANRGFEGMAFNPNDGLLYAFVQSPLRPDGYNNKEFIRILAINPLSGEPVHEYLSLLPIEAGQDKIGDAVYDAERDVFLVIERDSELGATANKSITEINLKGATDTLDYTLAQNGKNWADVLGGSTQPELVDLKTTPFGSIADLLDSQGIQMARREELFNLPSVRGADPAFDKAEGLALKPDGSLVFGFDNDFIKVADRADNVLTEVRFIPTPIDTNDRDGQTDDIAVRKLYGLTMADGLDAFSQGGETFIIVVGEGDDRAGDDPNSISTPDKTRAGSLNGADTANLGSRLNLSNTDGDYDGDGVLDQAYAFGSRSFRIYDQNQNLIFDSGNQLEEIAKQLGIYDEGRSDDKGTEPEMVTTQVINGRRYAFMGLERGTTSTVLAYDITDPYQPVYVQALQSQSSISPEGVKFIRDDQSGTGYLMVANEVSGTLEFFRFGDVRSAADQNQFNGGTLPEMMLPVSGSGFRTEALYTIGGGDTGRITGIPDGLGAYRVDDDTIRILINSEIGNDKGYSYLLASGAELKGARINFIEVNNAGQVVRGGLAYDTIYDRNGNLVTDEAQVRGPGISVGGLNRFCSANLVEANTFGPGKGAADRLFLLGEEFTNGTMWILDVNEGELWAAPDLAYGGWESAAMVDTGSTDTVAYFLGDDGPAGEGAPLYLYVGTKKADGNVLERNGLVGGQLFYWKSTTGVRNEDGLAEGGTDAGTWVAIDAQDVSKAGQPGYDDQGYKLAPTLRTEVFNGGGFMGYRVEDVDFNPNDPSQIAFNTTGGGKNDRAGDDKFGSVWTLDVSFNADGTAPATALLKHLYDGDAADNQQLGVRSPDNLAWSADGNIYVNEDRSTPFEGKEASIWKVNATSGDAERILVMNRDAALPAGQTDTEAGSLGAWESSGIIDVSALYGNTPGTDFFFTVQAHGVKGGSIDDQNLVEGGQIVAASAAAPAVEAFMTPSAPGYAVESLYTIGQSVAGFTATGIPDGLGAYRVDDDTIRILINSEIGNDKGYSYLLASGAELKGARINFIEVNNAGQVVRGGLAYDTIYDRNGNLVTDEAQVRGPGISVGGLNRFCSANLVEANTFGPGKGAADRLFLLGEEFTNGTMWILDVNEGELWAAPDLAYGGWESAAMVDTGSTDTVAYFLGDDGPAGEGAPLYLYVGTKKADGNVLERNGLVGGQLFYWKSTTGVRNEDGLAEGGTDAGTWVAIDAQDVSKAGQPGYDDQGYKLAPTLRTEVFNGGGFMGYRVEDVDFNPNDPSQIAFNTTGGGKNDRAGDDKFGSVWTLDVSFNADGTAPATALLKHLYDGDAADNQQLGVRSPDNLAWSADGNIYVNEDRSTPFEGKEASIWKVNATSGDAERILVMNRDAALPAGQTDTEAGSLGAWESSGIIDVSALYGNTPGTDFFFTVQAHGVKGGSIDDQNLVEGGQILRVSNLAQNSDAITGIDAYQGPDVPFLLDLASTGFSAVAAEATASREADFSSRVGFYRVLNENGDVRDAVSGVIYKPGDAGYAAAALAESNRVSDTELSRADDQSASEAIVFNEVNQGLVALYGTVLTTNQTFFSFAAANDDGYNHFKFLAPNKVGFEDLFGGGDKDHDDLIVDLIFDLISG